MTTHTAMKTVLRARAQLPAFAVTLLCSLLYLLPTLSTGVEGNTVAGEKMTWVPASDENALCNDFTRAGFFIRENSASNNWVIFLESGGLCYDRESCNRRFFVREVRESEGIRNENLPEVIPYGRFNPFNAWNRTVFSGQREARRTVSPLMSSMRCFVDSGEIEGRDILDTRPLENPLFHDYNHVLIPYCSSDLWLGEESGSTSAVLPNTTCSCFDYTTDGTNGCFNFHNSGDLLFTFRGKTIYQSIIKQLNRDHNLAGAGKVVLAGSSAGGVGVMNHARWTRTFLESVATSSVDLNVILDSSWFINFLDGVQSVFNLATRGNGSADTERLLNTIESNEACRNRDRFGYPCCISAHCVLTQRNESGQLEYYPEDTPTFALFSVYDIYLLAPGLSTVANLQNSAQTSNDGSNTAGLTIVLDFLRVAGEYAGTMNYTLDVARTQAPFLSSYVTQCFQHIYFATSTLWGADGGGSVFGSDSLEFTRGMASFRHSIQSGRWNSLRLASSNVTDVAARLTISEALMEWLNSSEDLKTVNFSDTCQQILCNDQCPDDLLLGELTSNNWPLSAKVVIAVAVVSLAVFCILVKTAFFVWLMWLERKQDGYLDQLENDEEEDNVLKFPDCPEDDAVAVSCLNLHYSVTFKAKKAIKDEKKDQTAPVVLNEIADQDSESETEDEPGFNRRRTSRYRRSTVFQRRQSQFPLPSLLKSATKQRLFTGSFGPADSAATEMKRLNSSSHRSRVASSTSRNGSQRNLPPKGAQLQQTSVEMSATTPTEEMTKTFDGRFIKKILKGISIYFNPGEMIGIMGPSGCGKTTFLDLLTARRKTGASKGEIYINGIPIDQIRDWYVANTGYVLQLAAPYYEQLTVRENLTFAAQMKLPKTFTLREKFERVEQVMEVTGLLKLADTPVGGATGPGLSGGQKKRLVIALQMLKLPSVIFLDEPTSGLDATASFELLTHLNKLADSNRTVILTIHQPRLEIFHMFHRLVLLSDGKISYHGAPEKAYEVFVSALTSRLFEQGIVIPSLEDHNPADVIMDMLGNFKMRQIITEDYQSSKEPLLVEKAIKQARWKEYSVSVTSIDSISSTFKRLFKGEKIVGERHGSNLTRMATLEARASKSVSNSVLFFLPFMFLLFAFVMGTTYIQEVAPVLVVAGMCVFSTSSALFMFPGMYLYFQPALTVYGFEKADGIGRAHDLVIQGFIRFQTISFFPVWFSSTLIYLLLVNAQSYNVLAYFQVVLTNVALNQTWIGLLIALICAFPAKAFRLSPVIAAVAGFTSGFFIPVEAIHWGYRWMVYINPNYYGLSSVAFFILSDFNTQCEGSELTCFVSSGPYVLSQFFFDDINPYLHIVILFGFTIFFVVLAVFANWVRHTSVSSKFKRIHVFFNKGARDELTKEFDDNFYEYERRFSDDNALEEEVLSYDSQVYNQNGHLPPLEEESEVDESDESVTEGHYDVVQELGEEEREANGEVATEKEKSFEASGACKDKWQRMAAKSLDLAEEGQKQEEEEGKTEGENGWNKVKKKVRIEQVKKRPSKLQLGATPTPKLVSVMKQVQSVYLRDGENHQVWRPKRQISEKVEKLNNDLKEDRAPSPVKPTRQLSSLATPTVSKSSLRSRQKTVLHRALATQVVLKETTDDLLNEADEEEASKPKLSLREASKRITANVKKQQSESGRGGRIGNIVSLYLTKMKSEDREDAATPGTNNAQAPPILRQRQGTRRVGFAASNAPGTIHLKQWKKFVRENKTKSAEVGDWDISQSNGHSQTQPLLEDTDSYSSGHRKIHKTASDGSLTKQVGLDRQSPQPSPVSKSPGGEYHHKPLVKHDSHELRKESKMAQMKKKARNRPTVHRQDAETLVGGSFDSTTIEEDYIDGDEEEEGELPENQTRKTKRVSLTGSVDETAEERQRKLSASSVDSQGRPRRSSPSQGWVNEGRHSETPPSSARPSSSSRGKLGRVEPALVSTGEREAGSRPGSASKNTSQSSLKDYENGINKAPPS